MYVLTKNLGHVLARGMFCSGFVRNIKCIRAYSTRLANARSTRNCLSNRIRSSSIDPRWQDPLGIIGGKRAWSNGTAVPKHTDTGMDKITADSLVWIDMEMTGLDPESCHILEIACLITDANLKVISKDFNIVVNQPSDVLDGMNDWCKQHHAKSGLTKASRCSKISLEEAESRTLNFISEHVSRQTCPMAGNTIYMDRMFLKKYMPRVDEYLHYRNVDVSTVKELVRRWNPAVASRLPRKKLNHRALDDIRESIAELNHYKLNVFL